MKISDVFDDLPTLETERILLRKFNLDDVKDMFEYTSIPDVSNFVPWETHKSIEDSYGFINYILKQYEDSKLAPWAIELKENQKVIGTIDFVAWYPQHRRAELGFILSKEHWGKGLIPEAAAKVIEFGFDRMNLNKIKAPCMVENVQSARVLQKLGMTLEGILKDEYFIKGKLRDMAVYSILKKDFQKQHNILG
ncbi:GNAT family N-acetyltransferase [Bacillus luteolus]|uniref:GNAT family N-acetyltransferase n=1 Tax=Litchfieldia luteola TaxID=682179 RepID=A0ABR9QN45_9BACI|nr:GNAT family protein [Cytobacillus luteolus]MBE4909925.1 GNAT family N-acetyltransferase [Cytobacillus luteolus]MBP1942519.1 ribosomal-protein-alanine N-acetyltransferase [Cytobacillus luteolus]